MIVLPTKYYTGDQIEKNEMSGECITYGGEVYTRFFVGQPEERRPLGRPRLRWEDNIKLDLQEVGWGHGLDLPGSGQGQVADTCKCGNEPTGSIKCGEFLDQLRTGQLLKKDCSIE